MPHLSPMSWTLTIIMLWFLMMILMSSLYFQSPTKFLPPKYSSSSISSLSWNWSLQDGRD